MSYHTGNGAGRLTSVEKNITATGANQGAAYQLTATINYVTSGNGAGVKLPSAVPGNPPVVVINDTAGNPGAGLSNAINVYPASSETILPNTANTRDYLSGNCGAIYYPVDVGKWITHPWDQKSDHINRTIGDTPNFYAQITGVNGASISGGLTINTGGFLTSTSLFETSTITPSTLGAGPTADYAPTSFSTSRRVRQGMSAAGTISGLAGGADGRVIDLLNISTNTSFTLTLTHDDAGSAAANRFYLPNGASLALGAYGSVRLVYDGTSSRWRVHN